jgi:hypothetical protein
MTPWLAKAWLHRRSTASWGVASFAKPRHQLHFLTLQAVQHLLNILDRR